MSASQLHGPKTPEVALAGQVCIDRNNIEGRQYTDWGSAVLFIADYYKNTHGIGSTVLSSHGPDFTPFSDGFSLHPPNPTATQTLIYENTVVNAERTQRCLNAEGEILPLIDEKTQAILAGADMFFLAPLTHAYDPDYVGKLMFDLPEDRLSILLPQGYLRKIGPHGEVSPRTFDEEPDIVPDFDLVIISEEDIPDAIAVTQEWKGRHPKTIIIVTKGPKGASVIEKSMEIPVPTRPVPANLEIDATGCGDTFSAAAALSLFRDPSDIYSAIEKANAATRRKLLLSSSG